MTFGSELAHDDDHYEDATVVELNIALVLKKKSGVIVTSDRCTQLLFIPHTVGFFFFIYNLNYCFVLV